MIAKLLGYRLVLAWGSCYDRTSDGQAVLARPDKAGLLQVAAALLDHQERPHPPLADYGYDFCEWAIAAYELAGGDYVQLMAHGQTVLAGLAMASPVPSSDEVKDAVAFSEAPQGGASSAG